MPDKLKKIIGLVVLLMAVGGVSCKAMLHTWNATNDSGQVELVK